MLARTLVALALALAAPAAAQARVRVSVVEMRGLYPVDRVRAAMRRDRPALRACAERGTRGALELRVVLVPEGRVSAAEITSDTVHREALAACVLSRARSWTIPPWAAGINVAIVRIAFE